MEVFVTVAQVVAPIFAAIILGILAKRKHWVTVENVQGFQSFVMKIGLPCALFNSCLTAQIGAESVSSMAMVLPTVLLGTCGRSGMAGRNFPITICRSCSVHRNPVCWAFLCLSFSLVRIRLTGWAFWI